MEVGTRLQANIEYGTGTIKQVFSSDDMMTVKFDNTPLSIMCSYKSMSIKMAKNEDKPAKLYNEIQLTSTDKHHLNDLYSVLTTYNEDIKPKDYNA